jgi:hypothetical protein
MMVARDAWTLSVSERLGDYARVGLWALPVWATLLLVGTWSHQPDPATNFPQYAEYITTTWFLISHLVASIFGAAIGIIGLIALFLVLSRNQTLRIATIALVTSVIGSVLVTAVFGAAAFAQPAIGNAYLDGNTAEAIAFDNDVYGPALFATALPGLLLFTIGLVLFGVAAARSESLPKAAGYLFAISGVLFAFIGFVIGPVQTAGAALLIVSTVWIAVSYRGHRASATQAHRIEASAHP